MEAGRLVASGDSRQIRHKLRGGRAVVVRLAGGEERRFSVADDDEQAALLHRLVVEEQLAVVEFREAGGLEEVFLEVTDGKVQ
jgi:hypothetical protein